MATLTFCKQLKAASKAFVSKMSGLRPFLQKIRQKLKMRRDKASPSTPSTLHVAMFHRHFSSVRTAKEDSEGG